MIKEIEDFLKTHPEIEALDAFIIDLCGNAVGKRLPRSHISSFAAKGSPICAAMQLVDVLGETADPMGLGFSNGDPDAIGKLIPGTLAPVPWIGSNRAQCMMTLHDNESDEGLWYEPRRILQKVVDKFKDLGLTPVCAVELEFYMVEAQRGAAGELLPAISPDTGRSATGGRVLSMDALDEYNEFLDAVVHAAKLQNIPVTTMINEYGAAQFEVNLHHQADAVLAADNGALLRRLIGGVARSFGKNATFMSKPFAEDTGSGMHIHLSLVDENGKNVLAPDYKDADQTLSNAIGGLQATLAESMAIFAPNINAWRRFGPDLFVPVTKDWGVNNRSVAFRVPPGDASARRIEHRASGAEANPYLVLAAVLAGVHHGLTQKLDAGEPHQGNACSEVDENLPKNLWSALEQLRNGSILKHYLGEKYPDLYAEVKQAEFESFMSQPFGREFEWYS